MLRWLVLSGIIIVLDQISKYFASASLELHQPVPIMPFLNFTLMHNEGAAFSFLSDAGGWQRWFLSALALSVSVFIIFWIRKLQPYERWHAVSLALILGGALGNVIDRIRIGYVVDFIDVYYKSAHWPAFNIADSAITVGAGILIFVGFIKKEEEPSK